MRFSVCSMLWCGGLVIPSVLAALNPFTTAVWSDSSSSITYSLNLKTGVQTLIHKGGGGAVSRLYLPQDADKDVSCKKAQLLMVGGVAFQQFVLSTCDGRDEYVIPSLQSSQPVEWVVGTNTTSVLFWIEQHAGATTSTDTKRTPHSRHGKRHEFAYHQEAPAHMIRAAFGADRDHTQSELIRGLLPRAAGLCIGNRNKKEEGEALSVFVGNVTNAMEVDALSGHSHTVLTLATDSVMADLACDSVNHALLWSQRHGTSSDAVDTRTTRQSRISNVDGTGSIQMSGMDGSDVQLVCESPAPSGVYVDGTTQVVFFLDQAHAALLACDYSGALPVKPVTIAKLKVPSAKPFQLAMF